MEPQTRNLLDNSIVGISKPQAIVPLTFGGYGNTSWRILPHFHLQWMKSLQGLSSGLILCHTGQVRSDFDQP